MSNWIRLPAGGPHELVIKADETKTFKDVLVGEVWICSGQSNMQWPVGSANDPDLETLTANYPNIRLISVPQVGVQEPQDSFEWKMGSLHPRRQRRTSLRLATSLDASSTRRSMFRSDLIDNAWGGSAAEAWVNREVLEEAGQYDELLEKWDTMAQTATTTKQRWRIIANEWQTGKRPRKAIAPDHAT